MVHQKSFRFPEIDLARGIAAILMVLFNWSFALEFLGIYSISGSVFYWRVFPVLIGASFIFLSGLSVILASNKIKALQQKQIDKKYFLRGAKIFLLGIGITAITYILYPQNTIFFGILHLIGFCVFFSPFLLKFKPWFLVLGTVLLIAGFGLQSMTINSPYLLWLGVPPSSFQTFDYWPVLPWIGVFLIGMYFGELFYSKTQRIPKEVKNPFLKPFCFLGRKSLWIYLAHQPILIGALYLIEFRVFG